MARGFLLRHRMKKELAFLMRMQGLEHLTLSNTELKFYNARKKLRKPFKAFMYRRRLANLQLMSAIKIQTAYRAYNARQYSYFRAF